MKNLRYFYGTCELTSKTSKTGKAELSRENACKVQKSTVYSRISGGIKFQFTDFFNFLNVDRLNAV